MIRLMCRACIHTYPVYAYIHPYIYIYIHTYIHLMSTYLYVTFCTRDILVSHPSTISFLLVLVKSLRWNLSTKWWFNWRDSVHMHNTNGESKPCDKTPNVADVHFFILCNKKRWCPPNVSGFLNHSIYWLVVSNIFYFFIYWVIPTD